MASSAIPLEALLERHGKLVDKKWLVGLTTEEADELAQVRAQIDRVEEPATDAWIARLEQARPERAEEAAVEHWQGLYDMKTLTVRRRLLRPPGSVRMADRTIAAVDVN